MSAEDDEEDNNQSQRSTNDGSAANVRDSTLATGVQTLVKFIFNKEMMEASMSNDNLDLKRMPLGKLSNETISKGYSILCDIDKAIKKHQDTQDLSS